MAATAFAGALLAFALPFGMVSSCGGGEVRFTGVELATYSVPGESTSDRELAADVERSSSHFAIGALLAAAAGLVLLALGLGGAGVCAWIGLVAMQLLLYGITFTSDGSDLYEGYLLSLLGFAVAGVVCLAGWIRARRKRGTSASPALAWALTVVLPPVGLIVSAVLAGFVWLVRRVAGWLRAEPEAA
jgi:hypothetical protein